MTNSLDLRRGIGRRQFLKTAGAGVTLSVISFGLPAIALGTTRSVIPFFHTHTGERFSLEMAAGGTYTETHKTRADEFLRDFRTGEVHPIDPGLLETLRLLRVAVGNTGTYEVISGYRSPVTNKALRSKGNGVAKRSMHMQGRAIDIRLSGVDTRRLRDAALELRRGGVGYYRRSDFIHVDTGRVRRW